MFAIKKNNSCEIFKLPCHYLLASSTLAALLSAPPALGAAAVPPPIDTLILTFLKAVFTL